VRSSLIEESCGPLQQRLSVAQRAAGDDLFMNHRAAHGIAPQGAVLGIGRIDLVTRVLDRFTRLRIQAGWRYWSTICQRCVRQGHLVITDGAVRSRSRLYSRLSAPADCHVQADQEPRGSEARWAMLVFRAPSRVEAATCECSRSRGIDPRQVGQARRTHRLGSDSRQRLGGRIRQGDCVAHPARHALMRPTGSPPHGMQALHLAWLGPFPPSSSS